MVLRTKSRQPSELSVSAWSSLAPVSVTSMASPYFTLVVVDSVTTGG
jgi:hypothetical protein